MKASTQKTKEMILEIFSKYYNKTQDELIKELNIELNTKLPKNVRNIIVKNILDTAKKRTSTELEQEIKIKTIRINEKGVPLESMSFSQIIYNDIVNEDWLNSEFYKTLNNEFLFVIFKLENKNDKNPKLTKVKFWKISNDDLELANKFWELTRDNIKRGDYKNFITIKNNFICHVRSKGINSKDLMETPQGTREPKKGYWLNSSYIKTQIN